MLSPVVMRLHRGRVEEGIKRARPHSMPTSEAVGLARVHYMGERAQCGRGPLMNAHKAS